MMAQQGQQYYQQTSYNYQTYPNAGQYDYIQTNTVQQQSYMHSPQNSMTQYYSNQFSPNGGIYDPQTPYSVQPLMQSPMTQQQFTPLRTNEQMYFPNEQPITFQRQIYSPNEGQTPLQRQPGENYGDGQFQPIGGGFDPSVGYHVKGYIDPAMIAHLSPLRPDEEYYFSQEHGQILKRKKNLGPPQQQQQEQTGGDGVVLDNDEVDMMFMVNPTVPIQLTAQIGLYEGQVIGDILQDVPVAAPQISNPQPTQVVQESDCCCCDCCNDCCDCIAECCGLLETLCDCLFKKSQNIYHWCKIEFKKCDCDCLCCCDC